VGNFFYKTDTGDLSQSNQIFFPDGTFILSDLHEQYTYPIDGWYWFDSEQQAREFFGLPLIDITVDE
jgi:hypothetical protein